MTENVESLRSAKGSLMSALIKLEQQILERIDPEENLDYSDYISPVDQLFHEVIEPILEDLADN